MASPECPQSREIPKEFTFRRNQINTCLLVYPINIIGLGFVNCFSSTEMFLIFSARCFQLVISDHTPAAWVRHALSVPDDGSDDEECGSEWERREPAVPLSHHCSVDTTHHPGGFIGLKWEKNTYRNSLKTYKNRLLHLNFLTGFRLISVGVVGF